MADSLARVRRATKRRTDSEDEWRASIRAAVSEGKSLRVVAEAAGVSNPRVHQIVREQ